MEPGGFFGSMTQAPLPSRGSPSHARPTSLWGGATAEDQFQKSQGHQKRVPHKTSLDGGDTATMAAEADGEEYKRKAPMTSVWGGDAGAKGVCLLSNAGTPLSLSLSLAALHRALTLTSHNDGVHFTLLQYTARILRRSTSHRPSARPTSTAPLAHGTQRLVAAAPHASP